MSVHAGTIIHVGGNNVIDRIQSAGLGDVRVTNDVIREVGNELVVDKVPQDPDFTFTLESFDVSTEIEAWLTGQIATSSAAADAPGAADPAGTPYKWSDCRFVSVVSPWKDALTGSAGVIRQGHLVPGYYPTRIQYQFGVTDNAQETVELSGGSYYYGAGAPVEETLTGAGQATITTADPAIPHRIGGADGTSFKSIFGIIVDGVLQTEGVDYTQSDNGAAPGPAIITWMPGHTPVNGAQIKFAYFTTADRSYPQPVHASTVVKPAAVRGRNICALIESTKVGGVQSFSLEATVDSAVEREFCNTEIVGITINGRDATGQLVVRSKNGPAFLELLSIITGVDADEVIGYLNTHQVDLEIQIQNPKNPAEILKTIVVDDAVFQVPGTPARVNTPTDFTLGWESASGDFTVYKGAR